jgi:hypothetical protein
MAHEIDRAWARQRDVETHCDVIRRLADYSNAPVAGRETPPTPTGVSAY